MQNNRNKRISDSIVHIGITLFALICVAVIILCTVDRNINNTSHLILTCTNIDEDSFTEIYTASGKFIISYDNDDLKLSSRNDSFLSQGMNYMQSELLVKSYTRDNNDIDNTCICPFESIIISLKYSQKDHDKLRQSSYIALVRPWLQSYTVGNLAKHQTYEETQTDSKNHFVYELKDYKKMLWSDKVHTLKLT